jgi:hypothetical protein
MSFGTSCQYIFLSLVSFTDFHFWIFSTMLSVVSFNISVTLFLVSIGASHFKSSIDSLSVLVSFSHSMAFSDDTTSVFFHDNSFDIKCVFSHDDNFFIKNSV